MINQELFPTFYIIGATSLIIIAGYVCFGFIYYYIKYNRLKVRNNSLDKEIASGCSQTVKQFYEYQDKISELTCSLAASRSQVSWLKHINNDLEQSNGRLSFHIKSLAADNERIQHNFNEIAKSKGMRNVLTETLSDKKEHISKFSYATLNHCRYCNRILLPGKSYCNADHMYRFIMNKHKPITFNPDPE